jgi:HlyD family secretion protein
MNATGRRLIFWAALGVLLTLGLVYAFWPRPVPVDLAEVGRGALVVTVDDEGETRVRDIFVLSAPVVAYSTRIEADVGDRVVANETVVAELEPIDPDFLDPRGRAAALAAVRAADSAVALAEAEVRQAEAQLEFMRTELERARELRRAQTISQRELDEAERAFKTTEAALESTRAALRMRAAELERARAQLLSPTQTHGADGARERIPLFAPVTGRVLRIPNDSARVVTPGEPLLEIGNPRDLEIVVDLLSSDAVKVEPGQRVIIEGWGGDVPLAGRVRRVEPFGFTKISALGIEEQRVNVIIDLTSPAEQWEAIGHGYQVDVRVVLWEEADVLKVPLTALFRDGDGWAVFAVADGRAQRRTVQVGRRTGLEAQLLAGLAAGERVIVHPGERVVEGVRIQPRS